MSKLKKEEPKKVESIQETKDSTLNEVLFDSNCSIETLRKLQKLNGLKFDDIIKSLKECIQEAI